jgi:pimeloyl-ACP methyl ester carboxylesterase
MQTWKQKLSGSKRNWGSFLKAFHRDMPERPIYALDLRSHGSSPHVPMTYEAMAEDVNKFVEGRNLRNVTILGHSMSVFLFFNIFFTCF